MQQKTVKHTVDTSPMSINKLYRQLQSAFSPCGGSNECKWLKTSEYSTRDMEWTQVCMSSVQKQPIQHDVALRPVKSQKATVSSVSPQCTVILWWQCREEIGPSAWCLYHSWHQARQWSRTSRSPDQSQTLTQRQQTENKINKLNMHTQARSHLVTVKWYFYRQNALSSATVVFIIITRLCHVLIWYDRPAYKHKHLSTDVVLDGLDWCPTVWYFTMYM